MTCNWHGSLWLISTNPGTQWILNQGQKTLKRRICAAISVGSDWLSAEFYKRRRFPTFFTVALGGERWQLGISSDKISRNCRSVWHVVWRVRQISQTESGVWIHYLATLRPDKRRQARCDKMALNGLLSRDFKVSLLILLLRNCETRKHDNLDLWKLLIRLRRMTCLVYAEGLSFLV